MKKALKKELKALRGKFPNASVAFDSGAQIVAVAVPSVEGGNHKYIRVATACCNAIEDNYSLKRGELEAYRHLDFGRFISLPAYAAGGLNCLPWEVIGLV